MPPDPESLPRTIRIPYSTRLLTFSHAGASHAEAGRLCLEPPRRLHGGARQHGLVRVRPPLLQQVVNTCLQLSLHRRVERRAGLLVGGVDARGGDWRAKEEVVAAR
eukprot:CAMPEP_0181234648 /NCGR_PEP_ID=MMETSP1096-20121128/37095_1 /TAXON_ID=156174 ORGANISM="Chrysochromulina ericina, Strain CCMP281" /NCGR_SAMPLE_ID=MMETSP1096 /ASSEMBLY_ACC=CAM_ASM_000453 /LENGTH=105 /DNA_ID=CAMNT_0023329457 /DNA_START=55 /DNA_END=372 /DNA_ORIENTATION=+